MKRRRQSRRAPPGAHIRAAVAYLRRCGADDILVTQNRGVRITWCADGHAMTITIGTRSGDPTQAIQLACQGVRRQFAAAGIRMHA